MNYNYYWRSWSETWPYNYFRFLWKDIRLLFFFYFKFHREGRKLITFQNILFLNNCYLLVIIWSLCNLEKASQCSLSERGTLGRCYVNVYSPTHFLFLVILYFWLIFSKHIQLGDQFLLYCYFLIGNIFCSYINSLRTKVRPRNLSRDPLRSGFLFA